MQWLAFFTRCVWASVLDSPIAAVPQGRCEIKARAPDLKSGGLGSRCALWPAQGVSLGKLFRPFRRLLPYLRVERFELAGF